jgi:hypothetical protein
MEIPISILSSQYPFYFLVVVRKLSLLMLDPGFPRCLGGNAHGAQVEHNDLNLKSSCRQHFGFKTLI